MTLLRLQSEHELAKQAARANPDQPTETPNQIRSVSGFTSFSGGKVSTVTCGGGTA